MKGISESAGQIPPANGDRFKPVAFLQRYGREIGLPVIVVALTVLFAANSEVFFSLPNFRNIGVSAAALAAVSFGQTFAILTAGLDLSVGSIVALVSIVGAIVMRDYGIWAGMIASLVTGAGVGLVNGIVITRFKVFPFITTLATMSIVSGLALSLSGGVAVTGVPASFADLAYELVLGVPVPVIIALMVLLIAFLVLQYTRLGRRIYAVGGNAEAARLSGATLFNGRSIPVTARFSDGSGMPTVPDGSPAMPRGIAIKYRMPGGSVTDMVTNSFKFFPVGTGEDFRDLLQAITASPPDAPHPNKLEQFFGSHPNAPKAIGSLPIPDSFADEEYHGIDAFIFVNKSGQRQAVRYVIAPEKLVHITPEEAAKQPPNYLFDELAKRIAQKPLVFHLKAQLAEPGDQTKDASQPWPEDRKLVDLGVLTLTKVVPNSAEAEKKLLFLPTNLTSGIELSDDPLPSVRSAAYGVSFGRRNQ